MDVLKSGFEYLILQKNSASCSKHEQPEKSSFSKFSAKFTFEHDWKECKISFLVIYVLIDNQYVLFETLQ